MHTRRLVASAAIAVGLGGGACSDKALDASGSQGQGASCEPSLQACAEGLSCEALAESEGHVCAPRVEIRGRVIDAITSTPVEGALIVAADALGTPVTQVVQTDADGRYALPVAAPRDTDAQIVEFPRWTLLVSAADYLAFPGSLRPALPIDAQDAVADDQEPAVLAVIDNASTMVALVPRPAGGVTITGQVEGERAAGTMVVAEGVDPPSLAVADLDGAFTLFNVPAGSVTIHGYRRGLDVEPAVVEVMAADIADVRLALRSEDPAAMSVVRGSVNIVDAQGGLATSVVLVPSTVYDESFERGPVPVGLRAPAPPEAPSITSAFEIDGVPPGRYVVLAAFENDQLVRDPDTSIAGTQVQQIDVAAGETIELDESFKITEALAVLEPGADAPQEVGASPTLVWVDDAGESRYEIVVRNALGDEVWRDAQLPAVNGSDTVEVTYGGAALTVGMYYQFRVTSWRDTPQGSTAASRSEDLRGVFVVR